MRGPQTFPEHGFKGDTHEKTPHLSALAGIRLEWRNQTLEIFPEHGHMGGHTRHDTTSLGLRTSDWSGKSDARARCRASGSVQASRMTALEMFPERDFMEGHTQEDTSSLGACGRTGVGNQTLEQGTV